MKTGVRGITQGQVHPDQGTCKAQVREQYPN
jgi:hypothetical protein